MKFQQMKALYKASKQGAIERMLKNKKGVAALGGLGGKVMGIIGGIIGLIVVISVVIAVEPTLTTEFNNWNASTVLPFGTLFENGTIYYLVLGAGIIALMIAGATRVAGRK